MIKANQKSIHEPSVISLWIEMVGRLWREHPEGTSNNLDIFQECQKILIEIYNGGLWEIVFLSINK